jgi:hypothetical protein
VTLDDISRLLIALAVVDVVCTVVIVRGAYEHPNPALAERAVVSVILTMVATFAAILAAARLGAMVVPPDLATIMFVASFLFVSIPQAIWAVLFVTGRFR